MNDWNKINYLTIDGHQIAYRMAGKGESICFLHGFCESSSIWSDFVTDFAGQYEILAIDLPGFGHSEVIPLSNGIAEIGSYIHKILNSLSIKRTFIIGHSMGGYVGAAFAADYPDFLSGICLFHSTTAPDSEEKKKDRDRIASVVLADKNAFVAQLIPALFAEKNRSRFDDTIESIQDEAKRTKSEGIIQALMAMKLRPDRASDFLNFNKPKYFIIGTDDPVIPLAKAVSEVELVKPDDILILEGCGHMGFIEEKEKTKRFLIAILEKLKK